MTGPPYFVAAPIHGDDLAPMLTALHIPYCYLLQPLCWALELQALRQQTPCEHSPSAFLSLPEDTASRQPSQVGAAFSPLAYGLSTQVCGCPPCSSVLLSDHASSRTSFSFDSCQQTIPPVRPPFSFNPWLLPLSLRVWLLPQYHSF